ncbi:glycosyltransferase [Shewanella xiamenensis]|uniref:glycosyltransferase n=1 Tax=Shewanella xiamenensis TaxID=332186 RepID=UPI00313C6557
MNTIPSIAVLLAAFNGAQYIREQLDSILNQEAVDLSIIISVDKSNDATLSIVNDYVSQYPNIVSILPYGQTYGSAGNNFTRLLCEVDLKPYQYISFADQDDIWLSDKLTRAVSEIKRNRADAYSSNVTAFWRTGKRKLLKKSYTQVDFDYLFESPGPGCTFLLTCTLTELIQSHLRNRLEKGETFWMHDWYCYSFARYHGFRWYIDPEARMLYRQHDLNVVGANSGWQGFMQRFKTIMNGDGFDKVLKQAYFIGQEKTLPIQLISSNKRLGLVKLFFISWKCRRQPSHKLMLSIACLIFFIRGYDSNNVN